VDVVQGPPLREHRKRLSEVKLLAEGVETQEVWDALREQGCSLAQGYFISKPAPPADLATLLDERAA
jgi:EAL domain-containing protein (putative c-di-GMP-specific phosphodiesterase class I)